MIILIWNRYGLVRHSEILNLYNLASENKPNIFFFLKRYHIHVISINFV